MSKIFWIAVFHFVCISYFIGSLDTASVTHDNVSVDALISTLQDPDTGVPRPSVSNLANVRLRNGKNLNQFSIVVTSRMLDYLLNYSCILLWVPKLISLVTGSCLSCLAMAFKETGFY